MCIAIYKPAQAELGRKRLRKCFNNNPDGAGYMFAHDGKIEIKKGYFQFDKFWKAYREDRSLYPESDFVVHFRIRTHGKIDKANCHPHRISNSVALAHNGKINNVTATGDKSDTIVFVEDFLATMPKGWEYNEAINFLISEFIGLSKLVLLHANGSSWILNECLGEWNNGCWFSNEFYKKTRIRKSKVTSKANPTTAVGTSKALTTTGGGTAPKKYGGTGTTGGSMGTLCPVCLDNKIYGDRLHDKGYCYWCESKQMKEYDAYMAKVQMNPDKQYCSFVSCGCELVFPHEHSIGVCITCQDKHNMCSLECQPVTEDEIMAKVKEVDSTPVKMADMKIIPAITAPKDDDWETRFTIAYDPKSDIPHKMVAQGFELLGKTEDGGVWGKRAK